MTTRPWRGSIKSNRLGMSTTLATSTTTMRIMRIGVAPTTLQMVIWLIHSINTPK